MFRCLNSSLWVSPPVQDKDFGKQALYQAHSNPAAKVSSSLKHYQQHSLEKAYKGVDFFWALTPIKNDYILFKFLQPIRISGSVSNLFHFLKSTRAPWRPLNSLIDLVKETIPLMCQLLGYIVWIKESDTVYTPCGCAGELREKLECEVNSGQTLCWVIYLSNLNAHTWTHSENIKFFSLLTSALADNKGCVLRLKWPFTRLLTPSLTNTRLLFLSFVFFYRFIL